MDPDLHYECGSRSRRIPDERFFTFEQSFFNQLIFDISFTVLYSENGNRNPIVGTDGGIVGLGHPYFKK